MDRAIGSAKKDIDKVMTSLKMKDKKIDAKMGRKMAKCKDMKRPMKAKKK